MRYIGSKSQIANRIWKELLAEVFDQYPDLDYFEPFVGGGNFAVRVMAHMSPSRKAFVCDSNPRTIRLLKSVQEGWEPPSQGVDRETWTRFRDLAKQGDKSPAIEWVGYSQSFCGTFFGAYGDENGGRQAYNWWKKHKVIVSRMNIFDPASYDSFRPHGCIVYCDPPYSGSYAYRRDFGTLFNWSEEETKRFWEVMREWSKDNLVFVSECIGPDDFEIVWEKEIPCRWKSKVSSTKRSVRLERVYSMYRSNPPTLPEQSSIEKLT